MRSRGREGAWDMGNDEMRGLASDGAGSVPAKPAENHSVRFEDVEHSTTKDETHRCRDQAVTCFKNNLTSISFIYVAYNFSHCFGYMDRN